MSNTVARRVVRLRDKGVAGERQSWAAIGAAVGCSPRVARSMYQSIQGAHSHHGLLPGKGGRLPKVVVEEATAPASATAAKKAPAKRTGTSNGKATKPAKRVAAKVTKAPKAA